MDNLNFTNNETIKGKANSYSFLSKNTGSNLQTKNSELEQDTFENRHKKAIIYSSIFGGIGLTAGACFLAYKGVLGQKAKDLIDSIINKFKINVDTTTKKTTPSEKVQPPTPPKPVIPEEIESAQNRIPPETPEARATEKPITLIQQEIIPKKPATEAMQGANERIIDPQEISADPIPNIEACVQSVEQKAQQYVNARQAEILSTYDIAQPSRLNWNKETNMIKDHHGVYGVVANIRRGFGENDGSELYEISHRSALRFAYTYDNEFKKLTPTKENYVFYRGVSTSGKLTYGEKNTAFLEQLQNAKKGEFIIPDTGYSYYSHAENIDLARGYTPSDQDSVLITAITPKGSKISINFEHDGEAIFPRNARFKILDNYQYKRDNGTKVNEILLEYIPEEIKGLSDSEMQELQAIFQEDLEQYIRKKAIQLAKLGKGEKQNLIETMEGIASQYQDKKQALDMLKKQYGR